MKTSQSYLGKSFPSVGPLQSFWKDWNVLFSPQVHFPLIENLFAHLPVEVTWLESTQRKQPGRALSRLWKSHVPLGKDHPAQDEWAKLAGFNSVRFFCMICTRSGLPFLLFPTHPWKKLTFSAAAKSSFLSTFHSWKTGSAHLTPYSSPNRTALELWQKWASLTRDITAHQQGAPPLLGLENPPIEHRAYRLLGMAQCPQAWLK